MKNELFEKKLCKECANCDTCPKNNIEKIDGTCTITKCTTYIRKPHSELKGFFYKNDLYIY